MTDTNDSTDDIYDYENEKFIFVDIENNINLFKKYSESLQFDKTPLPVSEIIHPENTLTKSSIKKITTGNELDEDVQQFSVQKEILELDINDNNSIFSNIPPRNIEDTTETEPTTDDEIRKEYFVNTKVFEPTTDSVIDPTSTTTPDIYEEIKTKQLVQLSWFEMDEFGNFIEYTSKAPLREVTEVKTFDDIETVKSFFLTDAEVEELKTDPRVKSVEIPFEQDTVIIETDATQTGNFSRASEGGNNPYDLVTLVVQPFPGENVSGYWNGIDFIPGEEVIQVANSGPDNIKFEAATARGTILTWADGRRYDEAEPRWFAWPIITLRNTVGTFVSQTSPDQPSQYVKGQTSGAIFRLAQNGIGTHLNQDSNWGLPRANAKGTQDDPIPNDFKYLLDGTGVDIVIVDTGIFPEHPEFQDADGNSRVVQHNWYVAAGRPSESNKQGSSFYTDQSGHGTHVAGIAAGKTFGWARNAKIFSMKRSGVDAISLLEGLSLIKAWHNNKPIDPLTGFKRPTIMNCSWSMSRQLGYGPPHANGFENNCYALDGSIPTVWNQNTTPTCITEVSFQETIYNSSNDFPTTAPVKLFQTTGTTSYSQWVMITDPVTGQPLSQFQTINNAPANVGSAFFELLFFKYILGSPFISSSSVYLGGADSQSRFLASHRCTVAYHSNQVNNAMQELINSGVHICLSAGNSNLWIVDKDDVNYNNYAKYVTYPETTGFGELVNNSWVLGLPENYSTPQTDIVYYQRKTSPYAEGAIIVGNLANQTVECAPFFHPEYAPLACAAGVFESQHQNYNPTTNIVSGKERRSPSSNYGTGIDIYAPGSAIMSCCPNYIGKTNGSLATSSETSYNCIPYAYDINYSQTKLSGTSMAAPQVCGVGALFLQMYPDLSPIELKNLLKSLSFEESNLRYSMNYIGWPNKWRFGISYCPDVFSVPENPGRSCDPNNGKAVTFNNDESIRGQLNGWGFGSSNPTIKILQNPYSETIPIDFTLPGLLVSQYTVSLNTVVNAYSSIKLTWSRVPANNFQEYIVERSLLPDSGFTRINTTPLVGVIFNDFTAEYDVPYYYRVYALGTDGTVSGISQVLGAVRVPIINILVRDTPVTNLRASPRINSIFLRWNGSLARDHARYDIYRSSTENGTYIKVNTSNIIVPNYTDTNVIPGQTYYYKVYSISYNGVQSPESDIVSSYSLFNFQNIQITSTEDSLEQLGWQIKGNVIKTTEAAYSSDGSTNQGGEEGIRLFGSAWVQKTISTVGYKNIEISFAYKNNKFKNNEILSVLYDDGSGWKFAFANKSSKFNFGTIILNSTSDNNPSVKIRFHAFISASEEGKFTDIDQILLYGQSIDNIDDTNIITDSTDTSGSTDLT